jgi:hypothetical protein
LRWEERKRRRRWRREERRRCVRRRGREGQGDPPHQNTTSCSLEGRCAEDVQLIFIKGTVRPD